VLQVVSLDEGVMSCLKYRVQIIYDWELQASERLRPLPFLLVRCS
jgi:hypothetical protein